MFIAKDRSGISSLTIISLVGLAIVIGGFIFYSQIPSNTTENTETSDEMMEGDKADSAMQKDVMADDSMEASSKETEEKGEGDMMSKSGSYENYEPQKVAPAAAKGNVVLFFHAAWCPYCRALEGDINKNLSQIPPNLTILKVDYDNSTTLKQKYGVTTQHTLVQVDSNGNLIKKWLGSPSLAALVSNL